MSNYNSGGISVRSIRLTVVAMSALALLSACGVTPVDGPRAGSFNRSASEHVTGSGPDGTRENLPFVLVDVDAKIANTLERSHAAHYFKGAFTDRRNAADIRVGFGDVVRITIFEAGTGGLFVPSGGGMTGGNFVTIPDQEVDRTGSIAVPYAAKNNDGGVIKVYGRRPIEIQAEIEQRLANRALEPQVVVTVVGRNSNLFSVLGDVNAPGRFNVTHNGVRVLDAISNAGGPAGDIYNTLITLQRGSKTATARMSTLVNEPENNIYLRPNDVLSVKAEQRHYNIYGSVGKVERVAFDTAEMTLADALGRAGGLDSERANPASVVLYRMEDAQTVKETGAQLDHFKWRNEIPTVYRVDFTQPDSYFLAQKVQLQDGDMIYAANHPLNDVTKILSIVRDILLIRLIDN